MEGMAVSSLPMLALAPTTPSSIRLSALPPSSLLCPGLQSACSGSFFKDGRVLVQRKGTIVTTGRRRGPLVTQAIFGLGVPELAVIAGVTTLIFGPKQLPEFGKSLGKTMKSFQQAAKEFKKEVMNSSDTTLETSASESPSVAISDANKDSTV